MNFLEGESAKLKITLNLFILSFALYGVSKRDVSKMETTAFENVMIETFAPMQQSVRFIQERTTSFVDNYFLNVNASKENVQLKKKVNDLEDDIFKLEQIHLENIRLKELLDFGEEIKKRKVLAQVVAWNANSDFRVLRINKGIKDGIKLQSTVVTSDGLVGYIYRITNHFADILTILDSNNRVDGLIERTRSHGIIEGDSNSKTMMKYIATTDPVILGDLVLTSGLGNIYPKGIRVGSVTKIERESHGIEQSIEVTPAVDFSRLEEVVILVQEGDETRKLEWEALDEPEQSRKN
ncbi:rod shape-determining protein MreC [Halobacteriovorax sp. GB3]|uniref:rod shape-determining protein MreC n=1 Tax=Halobacteriovorax sp. GB3 TaxID=2719615 RepID=UPI0023620DA8|nr:rod shape-determining protein MreC [Halobacteriovorax sp. GB3]MDD0852659.1 rod shape-determining protein MreC [Halobacteriovorax sp. GB3]